jgi:hypothetical protein
VTDEDRFDFHAWITNARPSTKSVTVFNRPDLVERVNELRAAAEKDEKPRTYAAKESTELKRAIEEMERSALTFVIKANNDEDIRTAKAAAKAAGVDPDGDSEDLAAYHLAQNIVDAYPGMERKDYSYDPDAPHKTFTASQVKSLRQAIREAQFTKLWLTMTAVSNRAPEPVPDFSRPSSPDRGTPAQ